MDIGILTVEEIIGTNVFVSTIMSFSKYFFSLSVFAPESERERERECVPVTSGINVWWKQFARLLVSTY